jgi:thiamine-phosphate pyrophosphorylase
MDAAVLRMMAITGDSAGGTLISKAVQAVEGGATCIQLRAKDATARELAELARQMLEKLSVPLIINDRADVAIAVGAAGCHLGPDDIPVGAVRRIAPPGFIIGCSVGTKEEIPGAADADYAGVGPVYTTSTKQDAGKAIGVEGFRMIAAQLSIPCVGIGGISAENAADVIAAGAAGVAVVSAIFGAPDVLKSARSLARAIGK